MRQNLLLPLRIQKLKCFRLQGAEPTFANCAEYCECVDAAHDMLVTNVSGARTTAGLAFGGTGLCSYRVRGVGGSCAEHLTVESYTIITSLQSYLLSYLLLLVFHHPLTLSL